jgi:ABC-type Fe3+ transport system substrate-binding protein
VTDPAAAGRLVARGLTDVRSVREILWPAFVAETGPAELDYRQDVDMWRLRAAVGGAAPGDRPDVLIVADPVLFSRDGLLVGAEAASAVPRLPAWVDADGRWTSIYVQPIVAIHNALYTRPPRAWTELADERYDGRVVVEAPERMLTTGPAFAELREPLGEAAWTDWLATLGRRSVRQVADNERAVLHVATGSSWLGLANWNVARRVRPGSPVRHVFLDPTPLVPAFAVVVASGRATDVARRFVTWLGSDDGQAAVGRTGRIPAASVGADRQVRSDVIPDGIGIAAGNADWISDPDRWIATFRSSFPGASAELSGKQRS